jgi:hypothetical protein
MRPYIILAVVFLTLIACRDKEVNSTGSTFWESIYMNLDGNQELTIFNYEDSAVFRKWTDSLVVLADDKEDWMRTSERTVAFKITTVEKDSLFHWTSNLMKPAAPIMRCTDYAGHLVVKINYGRYDSRTVKSCEYSSICDWNVVSADTKSIYEFLKTKSVAIE